jgi:hypothetical protein
MCSPNLYIDVNIASHLTLPYSPLYPVLKMETASQDFFDVVVIGGGMSGLSAATAAAEAGARVLLAEKGTNAGGSAIYVSYSPPLGLFPPFH